MTVTTPFGQETVKETPDEYSQLENLSEVCLCWVGRSAVVITIIYLVYLAIGGH